MKYLNLVLFIFIAFTFTGCIFIHDNDSCNDWDLWSEYDGISFEDYEVSPGCYVKASHTEIINTYYCEHDYVYEETYRVFYDRNWVRLNQYTQYVGSTPVQSCIWCNCGYNY